LRITVLRKRAWRAAAVDPISTLSGDDAGDEEIQTVKILLSAAALVGSLSLLFSDWSTQAFPYL
jgi:hypothetical protein